MELSCVVNEITFVYGSHFNHILHGIYLIRNYDVLNILVNYYSITLYSPFTRLTVMPINKDGRYYQVKYLILIYFFNLSRSLLHENTG